MLSVVVPLYNKAPTIARALDAIACQSDPPDEVVVVDDGSTDAGPEIVTEYLTRYPNWRLLRKENGGVSSARNWGIEHASHPYVCLLDADDVWLNNHCAVMKAMLTAHPECVLYVSGNVKRRNDSPPPTAQQAFLKLNSVEFYASYARRPSFVHTSAVAVARSALTEIGGFPTAGIRSQDIYVWLRLAASGQTCLHQGVTSVQRLDASGLGRRAAEIPYYIRFYTQGADVPANLWNDLRRILRRGALASWVASHSAGHDLSKPLGQTFVHSDPLMVWFFRIASTPGLRTVCSQVARQYMRLKTARSKL